MSFTCRSTIAQTRFLFDNFNRTGLMNTWTWKLDPYRTEADTDWQADVVIRNADDLTDETLESNAGVLSNEHSGFFRREVLRAADGGTLWRFVRKVSGEVYLSYKVSPDYKEVSLLNDKTESAGTVAFEYLNQMMPAIQLAQGVLTFHSALLEFDGAGFAICADSGTGKTTHARLWRDCKNALILNGDRGVFRKGESGWTAFGTPWSGTSGEQINRRAPLKALVLLERGSENNARKLSGPEAFRALFPHLLYPNWDRLMTMQAMELLDDLLCNIPAYRLTCRPDAEAVEVLYRAIYGESHGN